MMRGMQALGVAVELSPASVSSCIEQTRLGFMYAPYYHPVMKSVKSVRSALQVSQAAAGAVLQPCSWHNSKHGFAGCDMMTLRQQLCLVVTQALESCVHTAGMKLMHRSILPIAQVHCSEAVAGVPS